MSFKKKGKITVREAFKSAYDSQPDIFYMSFLIERAKALIGNSWKREESITRRGRELRDDHVINYKCINPEESKYQKL